MSKVIKTMTLNLSEKEMSILSDLAESKGMTKTAIMKKALRTYQFVDEKLSNGKKVYFQNYKGFTSELISLDA
jgi:predicted transcriptional regulator